MTRLNINAYLDFELTHKLEAMVINALPENAYQSDFNMLYLANIEIEDVDGVQKQTAVECDDTFFLSVVNGFNNIDYSMVKTIHVADIYESDYEVMSFYPAHDIMDKFANYYEGKPIPAGGGILNIAYSPFGTNKIEMINGDILHIYGNGAIRVTEEMIGFKGYKEIPRVDKLLSRDNLKIVKLAIYSRYKEYSQQEYTLNIFSPSMRIIQEEIEGQTPLSDDRIKFYMRGDLRDRPGLPSAPFDEKNGQFISADVSQGISSNLSGVDRTMRVAADGFIDASYIGDQLGSEFSVHAVFTIEEYSPKGSVVFEMGYGVTQAGFQTHHITLFVTASGELKYNSRYSDEWINTGIIVKTGMENIVTFTIENQKFAEEDDNEFVTFVHLNGKQIWPEARMYSRTEKIYIWRAMEAYRTFNEVCMKLPAPHPVSGGFDAKEVCARKLLHESGFITLDNLGSVYKLYLARPRPSKADLDDIVLNSTPETTIEKFFFGQDSEKDLLDTEYYLNGSFSEVAVFSPSLSPKEINGLHMMNILKTTAVKE